MARTLLVSLFFTATLVRGQPPTPQHIVEANKLLQSLRPEDTSYRHKDTVVKWKGIGGAEMSECHTDCSGFLDSLIRHAYPKYNAAAFEKWFGVKRPLARHYYDTIAAQKGFTRIDKIGDAQPGDIIAIKYPESKKDTGHTMLVMAIPKKRNATAPLVEGLVQWEVPIMDTSASGHGKSDSRRKSDGGYRGGLGTGNLRIYSDKNGAIAGYSWSTLAGSEFHDAKTYTIAVGRLDLKFEP